MKEQLRAQKDNSIIIETSSYSGGLSNYAHVAQKRAYDYDESLIKVKKYLSNEVALDRLSEANENHANKKDIKSKEFRAIV